MIFSYTPNSRPVAIALQNLPTSHRATGALHVEAGNLPEAKALYDRALHILEKELGPDYPKVASLLSNLGDLALEQGRPAEALEPLEREEGMQSTEPPCPIQPRPSPHCNGG